ncbi:uroporphyrinogen decarboxylase family protein [Chloroflexota bacterium]
MPSPNVERMFKAINRQESDRIPNFEMDIDKRVIEAIKPGLSYEDFCEYMDLDAICYHELRTDQYEVVDEAKGIVRDQWHAIKHFKCASWLTPMLMEPAIKSKKDLDIYVGPDPDLPSRYEQIEEVVKRFKGKRAVIAGVRPFSTIRDSLRGQVDLFKDMIRDPDMVDRLNKIASDYYMRYVKNLIDIGVDIIFETSDWAYTNGPMISPKHTERFIAPSLKEIIQYCHSRGVPCLKHTHGNIWAIFDLIVETGVDGVHPMDPLADMDLGEAKAKYGDKVCLMGNVDSGNLLSWGTKEEVREAVKECIRKAGKGGGYICTASSSIHGAVNPENYVEMVKAIHEYGKYPISI